MADMGAAILGVLGEQKWLLQLFLLNYMLTSILNRSQKLMTIEEVFRAKFCLISVFWKADGRNMLRKIFVEI